jgi:signal peptidase II
MSHSLFRLFIVTAVIFLDQWLKSLVIAFIDEYERFNILGFLDLTLIFNKGIAFSLFDYQSGLQTLPLIALSILAILFFIFLLIRNTWSKIEEFGILLIIGGAIGNLIDRMTQGAVTDFILFYYERSFIDTDGLPAIQHFYFPAFNMADSFITIGILMLLIAELLKQNKES